MPHPSFSITHRGFQIDPVKAVGEDWPVCYPWEAEGFLIYPAVIDVPKLDEFPKTLKAAFELIDQHLAQLEAAEGADDELSTARYSVIVTRDTTESVTILVDAVDEDEAEDKAIAASRDPNLKWEQDCTPNASKEHYTNGADLIEDELVPA